MTERRGNGRMTAPRTKHVPGRHCLPRPRVLFRFIVVLIVWEDVEEEKQLEGEAVSEPISLTASGPRLYFLTRQ